MPCLPSLSRFCAAALLAVAATACMAELKIDTDAMEPQLVITGAITTRNAIQTVTVATSTNYFTSTLPTNIPATSVTINGDSLITAGDGIFYTKESMAGVPGQRYDLEVKIDFDKDGVDEVYTASAVMPPVHSLDTLTLEPLIEKEGQSTPPWFIVAAFQDSPQVNYYGAALYVNGYAYSNRILRYYVHQLNGYEEGIYVQFPVMEWIIQHELTWDNSSVFEVFAGDVLTVELHTLSPEYYRYLSAVKTEVSQQMPLFSGPRGNCEGNISGGALGVWGAYSVSEASVVVPHAQNMPTREEHDEAL